MKIQNCIKSLGLAAIMAAIPLAAFGAPDTDSRSERREIRDERPVSHGEGSRATQPESDTVSRDRTSTRSSDSGVSDPSGLDPARTNFNNPGNPNQQRR
ncbi:MAG: hypothetical protein LIP28_00025 [Deltaproteobacteria bacterium]|nr:hypothetical protein [Deltaproteobacteria bacterium]